MTYSKLSLLRYFVLINCFFYAYSSNFEHNAVNTNQVHIDIYVLLDDSKIPSTKEPLDKFLNRVVEYEENHEKGDFGKTLIKCTTKDQEINLSFKRKGSEYCIFFSCYEIIESMRVGIEEIIKDYNVNKDTCPYSKILLYESLLELSNGDFDDYYENFLIYVIENKDKYGLSDISCFTYKGEDVTVYNGTYTDCYKELMNINSVKIFFKCRLTFKEFCSCFIWNCFKDFFAQIGDFDQQIKELEKENDISLKLSNLKNIANKVKNLSDYLRENADGETDKFLQKEDINFVDLLNYIEGKNKNLEDNLQQVKVSIEQLDSTPNIKFIQIPKKKVLNNSKLGLRKVCSCKCRS